MTSYRNKKTFSWCLYDWANSVIATIIFTFVFPVYLSENIIGDPIKGSSLWGYTTGIAGIIIALTTPIMGLVADSYNLKNKLIIWLSLLTFIGTVALFFMMPDPSYMVIALILGGLVTIGFEQAQALYNATLPDIAPKQLWGRLSGQAWAMGYWGGLACLAIALFGFIGLGDDGGFFQISPENDLPIRSTFLLTAGWYCVFAIPFLWSLRRVTHSYTSPQPLINQMKQVFQNLRQNNGNTLRFLIASAIYRDGLNTLFIVGGLYAAGTFGMSMTDILIFAIGLNVSAGIGAYGFSFIDDHKGSKIVIQISLIALIILGITLMTVTDPHWFIGLSLALGLFIGPAQSASRTMVARLTSPYNLSSVYSLYAMTGKSIAFTGPLLFAFLTDVTQSQRWGISAIIGLWVLGLFVLHGVKEKR